MGNVAIDIGKKRSYIVVEQDGEIVREGYVDTTADGLREYLSDVCNPVFIAEANSTLDRVANYLELYGGTITVAHPRKLRAVAESMKKTDRNDAHILLDMNRIGCIPESYLPDSNVRRQRDICRNRDFLVRQRTAVKNRIRDQAYRLCTDFDHFNSGTLDMLQRQSPVLNELVGHLTGINERIRSMERTIKEETAKPEAARMVDSVPGIGPYGALGIVAGTGKIDRFPSEDCIFSYAGLVPEYTSRGAGNGRGTSHRATCS